GGGRRRGRRRRHRAQVRADRAGHRARRHVRAQGKLLMRLAYAFVLLFAWAGCSQEHAVELTLTADASLADPVLASIRNFTIATSGAETGIEQVTTSGAFANQREERMRYRPLASSGDLTLAVTARDQSGKAVGFGQGTVTLSGGSVPLSVALTNMIPP